MESVKKFFENDRFAALIGAELTEVKPGYAKARMLVEERHLNGVGCCQGGALFTLADLAFAAALNSHLQVTISINANIAYIHSIRAGWIFAEAHEIVDHFKLPYAEVRITDEERQLLAVFTATGYRKSGVFIPADEGA